MVALTKAPLTEKTSPYAVSGDNLENGDETVNVLTPAPISLSLIESSNWAYLLPENTNPLSPSPHTSITEAR
jgi:hypothetical protein